MCVCVGVLERERERERVCVSACVRVCVWVWWVSLRVNFSMLVGPFKQGCGGVGKPFSFIGVRRAWHKLVSARANGR